MDVIAGLIEVPRSLPQNQLLKKGKTVIKNKKNFKKKYNN